MSRTDVTIAVLGLGEAGGAFARDLREAGAGVRGYDPAVPCDTDSEADAAKGADLGPRLTGAEGSTVDRLVSGTRRHAVRRTAEMAAAAEMLGELGVPADVAGAARDQLARLSSGKSNATKVPKLGEELR